ncbi:MAG: redoxin family protein [Sphingomonas sp.]
MKRVLIWLPLALFAAIFTVVASGLVKPGDRMVHSAMVGQPMPALNLPALVPGKAGIATADFGKGKPRLLNIFASWCIPCIAEAPQLMKLKAAGAEIDAVAVRDTAEAMQAFLKANGDPYTRIGDDKASVAQLALGSSGVPETFVIDARGRIAYQHIGDVREDDVPKLLAELEKAK